MCAVALKSPAYCTNFHVLVAFFAGGGLLWKAAANKIFLFIMVQKSCYRQLEMVMAALWQFTSCHSVIDAFQIIFTW